MKHCLHHTIQHFLTNMWGFDGRFHCASFKQLVHRLSRDGEPAARGPKAARVNI